MTLSRSNTARTCRRVLRCSVGRVTTLPGGDHARSDQISTVEAQSPVRASDDERRDDATSPLRRPVRASTSTAPRQGTDKEEHQHAYTSRSRRGRCVRCGDLSLDLTTVTCRDCRRRVRHGIRPSTTPLQGASGVPDTGEGVASQSGPYINIKSTSKLSPTAPNHHTAVADADARRRARTHRRCVAQALHLAHGSGVSMCVV